MEARPLPYQPRALQRFRQRLAALADVVTARSRLN
jgi:hypothetical protein